MFEQSHSSDAGRRCKGLHPASCGMHLGAGSGDPSSAVPRSVRSEIPKGNRRDSLVRSRRSQTRTRARLLVDEASVATGIAARKIDQLVGDKVLPEPAAVNVASGRRLHARAGRGEIQVRQAVFDLKAPASPFLLVRA